MKSSLSKLVPHRRSRAAGVLAGGMLALAFVTTPGLSAAQAVAPPAQWASALRPSDVPPALAGLLAASRGSGEAQAGRALIARWNALPRAQRAAAAASLEASLSELSPRDAVRVAFLLPLFDGREAPLVAAVQAWAQTDTPGCVAWIAARRPGPAREAATRAVAAIGDVMQAPDAAAWAAHELPSGAIRDAALASALARWSAENPVAAAEWAQVALDGPLRARALARALEAWGARDPRTAQQWLDGNASAPEADAARAGLVQALVTKKPTEALAVAGGVTVPEERQALFQGSLKEWHAPIAREGKPVATKQ